MDTNKMREQFEKRIHQPAGSYWCEKDRTYRYEDYDKASSQIHECQWQAWIAAWQASREAVAIDLPSVTEVGGLCGMRYWTERQVITAVEAEGLRVAP